ncbi:probable peptide/nitrate transporter At3g43790 isoform X3 [Musa acuminata AAA Group]|uniref:probable peptide/nitrate transporter At3g43790 isoform X3 n=1 Tax=Musa acuminata AAA Group TaxID=214697 RepID=UPI0031D87932
MAMAERAAPLLAPSEEATHHENCPGCRQDRRNQLHLGIPYREFFYVWIVALCSALPISSLYPFLYFMIRDLDIAKREEDIGFYAGFVGSAFMLGRALTSILWGMVADRYGRRPVIMISLLAVIVFNTLFGLSTRYWMAIMTRSFLGFLSGLLGPIQAYASEVCRKEYQALGLSVVDTSWAMGLVFGPAIGGFLAQPAEKYPNIFSAECLFGRFPYFLPCLCISLFSVGALIACFWLPETLHMHGESKVEDEHINVLEALSNGSNLKGYRGETKQRRLFSDQSLLKNWLLMSSIIVYCIFGLQSTAYSEIFSLWSVSNKKYGGLSFSSQEVGMVLAISGISLLVYQLVLFPHIEKHLGPINLTRAVAALLIPLLASYPFMTKLSGFILKLSVNCASSLRSIFSSTITVGLNILQNNAVSQHQRGAANGMAVTALSLFKAFAPAGAGILFSWAQNHQGVSILPACKLMHVGRYGKERRRCSHQYLHKGRHVFHHSAAGMLLHPSLSSLYHHHIFTDQGT